MTACVWTLPWVRIQSPVNLRGQLSPPVGDDFGCYVSLAKTSVDCSPHRQFWDIARDVRDGLSRASTPEKLMGHFVVMQATAQKVTDLDSLLEMMKRRAPEMAIDYDLSLSNLGQVRFPVRYGALQLQALYGPTFSAAEGDRIVGVTTFDGRMHFTFVYRKSTLDQATGEAIWNQAMDRLRAASDW
jgi:hypothetical protein